MGEVTTGGDISPEPPLPFRLPPPPEETEVTEGFPEELVPEVVTVDVGDEELIAEDAEVFAVDVDVVDEVS